MIGGIKSIGVIGNGVVGRATARCYLEHAEVKVYDVIKERAAHSLEDVLACDLTFICLPTPQLFSELGCDTRSLLSFFEFLGTEYHNPGVNLVLRSTVPIGYTADIRNSYQLPNLVHSPEFLTARCAVTDAQLPARNVIGGLACECRTKLFNLYTARFPGVKIYMMPSDESEAVKLFTNGFFATKIAYFNEINSLCSSLRLHWPRVLEAMLSDGRIAHSHTQVPGPDGKYGFGGPCLPKDLANLITAFEDDVIPYVTTAAYTRNKYDRERSN